MRKRILLLVAIVVLAMGLTPAFAFAVENDLTSTADGLQSQSDDAYAILYEDGTLVFQRGNAAEDGHGVAIGSWTGFEKENNYDTRPWTWWDKRSQVKKAVFKDKVTPASLDHFFEECDELEAIEGLSNLDTSKATSMESMFRFCKALTSPDFSSFDTSKITNMNGMFLDCTSLLAVNCSGWDTSNVTDMSNMFNCCTNLSSLDLSRWNTSSLTLMSNMFEGCYGLTSLNLSGWDTSGVTHMDRAFAQCTSLETLDLSSFDTSSVEFMWSMFGESKKLSTLTFGPAFKFVVVEGENAKYTNVELPDITRTDVYTGDWVRSSDGAVASSYSLMWRDDVQGTWTWQRKSDSGSGDSASKSDGAASKSGASEPADEPKSDLTTYAGEAKKAGFTDLAADAWYLNDGGRFPDSQTLYLDYTIARGLMSGYTGARKGQFGPDDDLSRGMAATIIYRMATGKTAETTDNDVDTPFSDVPRGAWYAAAVKWCAEEGVVTGYAGTTKFGPDDPITREQLATVIGRYMDPKATSGEDVSQFKDASSISAFAKGGIAYCNAKKVMTGIGDSGNFNPQGLATRCQMSKVIAVTARMAE